MKKYLLITNEIEKNPKGGRELLCKLNYDILSNLFEDELKIIELKKKCDTKTNKIKDTLQGNIDGINSNTIKIILQDINKENIIKIFIDGSNLGAIVVKIKKNYPSIEIITYFHNVEARFFWGLLKKRKNIKSLGVLLANYLAEKSAVKYSDNIICLSSRDSNLLYRIYGRKSNYISPISLEDKFYSKNKEYSLYNARNYALFVGSNFYANVEGIRWFITKVVPFINIPVYIVGNGFDELFNELSIPKKVIVVGAVDNLNDWYHNSKFVIAPIFDGSGMKTKVAEALMFGKKVIGTKEAFVGYEDELQKVGWLCNSSQEFIETINHAERNITSLFDSNIRTIYENKYSYTSMRDRYIEIFKSNNK